MTDSGKNYQLLLELLGECLLGNRIFIDYSGRLYFLKMATTEFLIPHTLCNVTLPPKNSPHRAMTKPGRSAWEPSK